MLVAFVHRRTRNPERMESICRMSDNVFMYTYMNSRAVRIRSVLQMCSYTALFLTALKMMTLNCTQIKPGDNATNNMISQGTLGRGHSSLVFSSDPRFHGPAV